MDTEKIISYPLKGTRKRIAERLGAIWQQAVHVTLHKEIDITCYYEHKSTLAYSLPDYVLYGLVQTLVEERFGNFNAHYEDGVVYRYSEIHLGIAVDHPRGLIVPVLQCADAMNMDILAAQRKALIERAKIGKLLPDEMTGGTFTVTNLGLHGIDTFTPILNPPQVAILGLGRMRVAPVAWRWGDDPSPKALMPLSLTIDHRVLDGADGAKFLEALEHRICSTIIGR